MCFLCIPCPWTMTLHRLRPGSFAISSTASSCWCPADSTGSPHILEKTQSHYGPLPCDCCLLQLHLLVSCPHNHSPLRSQRTTGGFQPCHTPTCFYSLHRFFFLPENSPPAPQPLSSHRIEACFLHIAFQKIILTKCNKTTNVSGIC